MKIVVSIIDKLMILIFLFMSFLLLCLSEWKLLGNIYNISNIEETSVIEDKSLYPIWWISGKVVSQEVGIEKGNWDYLWHKLEFSDGFYLESVKNKNYNISEEIEGYTCIYIPFEYNDKTYYLASDLKGNVEKNIVYEYVENDLFIESNDNILNVESIMDDVVKDDIIKGSVNEYKKQKIIVSIVNVIKIILEIIILTIISICAIRYFRYINKNEVVSVMLHLLGEAFFITMIIPLLLRSIVRYFYL